MTQHRRRSVPDTSTTEAALRVFAEARFRANKPYICPPDTDPAAWGRALAQVANDNDWHIRILFDPDKTQWIAERSDGSLTQDLRMER